MTIEKAIKILWLGPHDPPEACIDSWVKAHPVAKGWSVEVITQHYGWVNQPVIDKMLVHHRSWAGAAAIVAYELLASKTGGIVVHADSECLTPLDLADKATGKVVTDFFDLPEVAWASFRDETKYPGVVTTAAMGSSPYSEVYAKCIEMASQMAVESGKPDQFGPPLLSKVALEFPDTFKIFHSRLFNASGPALTGPRSRGLLTSYAKHHTAGGAGDTSDGYNKLRNRPCGCGACAQFRPPWM